LGSSFESDRSLVAKRGMIGLAYLQAVVGAPWAACMVACGRKQR
jgi:hypothetical protein